MSPDPNYDELDPGIRRVVRWLREAGFDTCDSGDGISKFLPDSGWDPAGHDELMRIPHVAMTCGPEDLVRMADRIAGMLSVLRIDVGVQAPAADTHVQLLASYDPFAPEFGLLVLTHFTDAQLVEAQAAAHGAGLVFDDHEGDA